MRRCSSVEVTQAHLDRIAEVDGDLGAFLHVGADAALAAARTVDEARARGEEPASALAGVPIVVGYRLGAMTHAILKRLIRTPYITLFNIAAKDFVAPELVQDDCNGPALAREIALRLDDPALRERQAAAQTAALQKMGRGGPDPSDVAAEAVLKALGSRA